MLVFAQTCKINMLTWEGTRRAVYGPSAYGRTGTGYSADEQVENVRLITMLYFVLCVMEFLDIL